MKKTIVFFGMILVSAAIMGASGVRASGTELTYRLKWLFNASVAGDIYADTGGFFQSAGLKVQVKEGSPEKNAINELELGHADFGVASADQVIRALEKGAGIVVLAQLFQINPMQWIYRADGPEIRSLEDLRGRSIGITFGGNDETVMNTILARAGIAREEVRIFGVRFDFTPFFMKEVDIWPVYRNSQGVILKSRLEKEGETVRFFNPADFGVQFVANSVVTSEKTWKTRPDVVNAFMKALIQAWEAAMDPSNEVRVLDAIKKRDRDADDGLRRLQLVSTRELIKPSPDLPVGTIDTAAWQQTEAVMLAEKQIRRAVRVETVLHPVLP